MLHYQYCVSPIPQAFQKIRHTVYVTGMHSGTGLVKNVSHSGQCPSHIPHQFQSLGFSTGECGRLPIHGKIGKSDINHSGEGGYQSVHDSGCSRIIDGFQHFHQFGEFHFTHFTDIISGHFTGKRLFIQSFSMTYRTDFFGHQRHHPFHRSLFDQGSIPVQQHLIQIICDSFHLFRDSLSIRRIGSIQQPISFGFCKILPLFIQWKNIGFLVLFPVPVTHMKCR